MSDIRLARMFYESDIWEDMNTKMRIDVLSILLVNNSADLVKHKYKKELVNEREVLVKELVSLEGTL